MSGETEVFSNFISLGSACQGAGTAGVKPEGDFAAFGGFALKFPLFMFFDKRTALNIIQEG